MAELESTNSIDDNSRTTSTVILSALQPVKSETNDSLIAELNNIKRYIENLSGSCVANVMDLKEIQLRVLQQYYDQTSFVPLSCYQKVNGFNSTAVIKLKELHGLIEDGPKSQTKQSIIEEMNHDSLIEEFEVIKRYIENISGSCVANVMKLKEMQVRVLQQYYDQTSIVSLSCYQKVDGFNSTAVIKLKGLQTSIARRLTKQGKQPIHFHDQSNDDNDFKDVEFAFSLKVKKCLKDVFKLNDFRPMQLEAINAIMLGNDCLIMLPTGGGKSLCYQLPAAITKGITFVISPLKSLIIDQLNKCKSLNIRAAAISADLTIKDYHTLSNELRSDNPSYKIVFVTPERMATDKCKKLLKEVNEKSNIARFIIDEAHCISIWGHDFRVDYMKLDMLRKHFKNVPIVALTATATLPVRTEIVETLDLRLCKRFVTSFNRPNIVYSVEESNGQMITRHKIAELIKASFKEQSGIVYCHTKKNCETMSSFLISQGINATFYHADLRDDERADIQCKWSTNEFHVICATIAFGMGIDKGDVRYVIHETMPSSIESYYQESGRAGRDGETAHSYLFYSYGDKIKQVGLILSPDDVNVTEHKERKIANVNAMLGYCYENIRCRRVLQLQYLGEVIEDDEICPLNNHTQCDNCKSRHQYHQQDVTNEAKSLLNAVRFLRHWKKMTVHQMVKVLKGTAREPVNIEKSVFFGAFVKWNENDLFKIFQQLITKGYLVETFLNKHIFIDVNVIGNIDSTSFDIYLKRNCISAAFNNTKLNGNNPNWWLCYKELSQYILEVAMKKEVLVSEVLKQESLIEMCNILPIHLLEMSEIQYMSQVIIEEHGINLLKITKKYNNINYEVATKK